MLGFKDPLMVIEFKRIVYRIIISQPDLKAGGRDELPDIVIIYTDGVTDSVHEIKTKIAS